MKTVIRTTLVALAAMTFASAASASPTNNNAKTFFEMLSRNGG